MIGRHGRDGTTGTVAGSGGGGRGEETLPAAKKYFQPLAFAEVMAASSCRGRRSGPLSFFTLPLTVCSPLPSTRYISLSLIASSVIPWPLLLSTIYPAIAFRGIVGGALSKFARDCAPFEAHLIDQVLMKMIPRVMSVARYVPFIIVVNLGQRTIHIDVSFAKQLHTSIYC